MAVPTPEEIEAVVIEALERKGGRARPAEVYAHVGERFRLHLRELAEKTASGDNALQANVQKAARNLEKKGELDHPGRGLWRVTGKGSRRLRPVVY